MRPFERFYKVGIHHDTVRMEVDPFDFTPVETEGIALHVSAMEMSLGRELQDHEWRLAVASFLAGVSCAGRVFGRQQPERGEQP